MRHADRYHAHLNDRLLASALILEARERAGISQRELARRADTSQPLISAYERGTKQPTLPMLLRLLRRAGMELRTHLTVDDGHDVTLIQSALRSRRNPNGEAKVGDASPDIDDLVSAAE